MEQNKKVDPKIKGIKFVMDNGEEKYLKGSFVFGCAISIEDSHCESFMIGENARRCKTDCRRYGR